MGDANQAPNPTKLRMAVNALRYALKHPLTSHAGGDGGTKKSFERMTKLQIARMRPRRPYVPGRARAKGRKGRKGRAVAGDEGEAMLGRLDTVLGPMPALSETRSRLHQRRFWQPNSHFSAFVKI